MQVQARRRRRRGYVASCHGRALVPGQLACHQHAKKRVIACWRRVWVCRACAQLPSISHVVEYLCRNTAQIFRAAQSLHARGQAGGAGGGDLVPEDCPALLGVMAMVNDRDYATAVQQLTAWALGAVSRARALVDWHVEAAGAAEQR